LKKSENADLLIQINLFNEWQQKDEDEALLNNGFDLNNSQDLFNAICLKTQQTIEYHQKFVEILQVLFLADEGEGGTKLDKEKLVKIWEKLVEAAKNATNNLRKTCEVVECETQTDEYQIQSIPSTAIIQESSLCTPPPPPPFPSSLLPSLKNHVLSQANKDTQVPPPAPPPPPPPPPFFGGLSGSAPPPPPPPPFFIGSSGTDPLSSPPPPSSYNGSTGSKAPPPPPPPLSCEFNKTNSSFPAFMNPLANIPSPIFSLVPKTSKAVKNLNWQKLPDSAMSKKK
jgi:hypothetical protein